jgi:hypothetical protein
MAFQTPSVHSPGNSRTRSLCPARAVSHCSLRSRGSRSERRCLPLSLADDKRVRSLVRPGQRRAILGALWIRRRRRRSQRKEHLRSLLLRAAVRDSRRSQDVLCPARAVSHCSLRSRGSRFGSASVAAARRGKNASARSSSVRRRAIPDARRAAFVSCSLDPRFPTLAGV